IIIEPTTPVKKLQNAFFNGILDVSNIVGGKNSLMKSKSFSIFFKYAIGNNQVKVWMIIERVAEALNKTDSTKFGIGDFRATSDHFFLYLVGHDTQHFL